MSVKQQQNTFNRAGEQGGIVILVCLMLVALLSVTAFTVSQNVMRETAITGNVLQAGRADTAANAGLDWMLVWLEKGVTEGTTGMPPLAQSVFEKVEAFRSKPEMYHKAEKWNAQISAGGEMVLTGKDGKILQAFDTRMEYLGASSQQDFRSGDITASGSTVVNNQNRETGNWEITSVGNALVHLGGDNYWKFQTTRAIKSELDNRQR